MAPRGSINSLSASRYDYCGHTSGQRNDCVENTMRVKWTASEKTYVYHFLVLGFSAANHLDSVCLEKEMSHASKTK